MPQKQHDRPCNFWHWVVIQKCNNNPVRRDFIEDTKRELEIYRTLYAPKNRGFRSHNMCYEASNVYEQLLDEWLKTESASTCKCDIENNRCFLVHRALRKVT